MSEIVDKTIVAKTDTEGTTDAVVQQSSQQDDMSGEIETAHETNEYFKELYAPSRISEIEMRNLILQALAEENPEKTPRKATFQQYRYRGSIEDLRAIVEYIATQKSLIPKVVDIRGQAWACSGEIPRYKSDTNFNLAEQDVFVEEFYSLLYQNVVAAGGSAGFTQLPYFHVTTFGRECLLKQDVLPFDQDKYLASIQMSNPNDWEVFYISEALRCYNCGAYSASIMIIGILGEYIAEQLIEAMDSFLGKNEPALQLTYQSALGTKRFISNKYEEYENQLKTVNALKDANNAPKYPTIFALKPKLDVPAHKVYNTYVRLTRNSIAHPSDMKMERLETLMLFVSFIKYFDIQHKYLAAFKALS